MIPAVATNTRGQATLEAVLTSTALVLWVGLLMGVLHLGVVKTILEYSSHELLVCRVISDPWKCESEFKDRIKPALLSFIKIDLLWARKERQKQVLTLKLRLQILKKEILWTYEDQILLPLKGS